MASEYLVLAQFLSQWWRKVRGRVEGGEGESGGRGGRGGESGGRVEGEGRGGEVMGE